MDTNQMIFMMQMMAQKQSASLAWGPIIVTIVGMLIAAVIPTIAALKAAANSKEAVDTAKGFKEVAIKNADSIEKVHVAVNSERTLMLSDNKNLKAEILVLSQKLAAYDERQRMQDLKDAKIQIAPAPSLTQADITQIAEKVVQAQA